MQWLTTRYGVLDGELGRVEGCGKGDQGPPCLRRRGHELRKDEGARWVIPLRLLRVEQVSFNATLHLVDSSLLLPAREDLPPPCLAAVYEQGMPRSFPFQEPHHAGKVSVPVGPDVFLLRAGRQVRGLEVVAYRFGSELPAVMTVVGVSKGVKHGEVDVPFAHPA